MHTYTYTFGTTTEAPVGNAWCREAHTVLDLATRQAVTLDRETMVLSDVRDLQRLAACLRRPARGPGHWLRRLY